MHFVLWILQVFLGNYFIFVGVMHFIVPTGLPDFMAWMYELSTGLHYFTGTAEIVAGVGLILPGLTRRWGMLAPGAGVGIVLLMAGAVVWHAQRGEIMNIMQNLVLGGCAGFISYGRWCLYPHVNKRSPR